MSGKPMKHLIRLLFPIPLLAIACVPQPPPNAPAQTYDVAHCRNLREAQRSWGFVQYTTGPLAGLSGASAGLEFPADDAKARMALGLSSAALAAVAAGATWLRGDLIEQYSEECAK